MSGVAAPRHVFVANRGEIAGRIAATCDRLGIGCTLAAVDGPGAVDLLDAAAVVRAARAAGADAVHPGYGFLAESPVLASAVTGAGLTWVGPPAEAIRALGDKAEARSIARAAGVPVADGEEPADQSDGLLAAAAERIGYPVLVKPAAGGGGKGIRVVAAPADLADALATARREAARSFGDERLLLERYVEAARHVEVQLLADAHGDVVHLGERDCSLQRRHQKLLEEAPAPGLDDAVRRSLWGWAVALGRAVGYVGAGTCEFLVADDGSVAFLEVNARLQVEHPVTELLLGRDLVADQLAVAGGARLADIGLDQAAIEAALAGSGHAAEVRLNAEDPGAGFLPTTGGVVELRWPADAAAFGPVGASGIRVDAGIDAGDAVTGRFDPLLAKVIATGPDREAALDRLAGALDATEVLGLATNLAFLRRLVRLAIVREGRARTTSVDDDATVHAAAEAPAPDDAAWATAARALAGDARTWGAGWRANLPAQLHLVADDEERRPVLVGPEASTGPGTTAAPPVHVVDGGVVHLSVAGQSVAFRLAPPPDVDGAAVHAGTGGSGGGDVRSPMPGAVIAVHVAPGSEVAAGTRIATIEAMKMEHAVTASGPGRVEEVRVRVGDQVARGDVVARLGHGA